jgi:tetratricopeptide (TPR) repeat protein
MLETPTAHSEIAMAPGRRRRVRRVGMVVAVVVLAAGTWMAWRWYTTPSLPAIDLSAVEPAVAAVVTEALDGVQQQPRSGEAWGQLGMVLLANSFYAPAEACFIQAQRFEPENPAWPYLLAVRLLLSDRDAAMTPLARAAELCASQQPENTAPRLQLAETLFEKEDLDAAEIQCRKVIERQPDNPRVHYNLGLIAYARGDLQQSIGFLSRSAASPLAARKSALQLAAIYQRLGEREKAKEFAARAADLPADRSWPDPYVADYMRYAKGRQNRFLQAEDLEHQGRLDEAIPILWQLAKDSPEDRTLDALGTALAKAGDDKNAEGFLRQALLKAPGRISARYALSVALYNQGEKLRSASESAARKKYEEAATFARQTIALKAEHAWAHCFLGHCLWRLGDRKTALAEFEAAVHLRPELPDLHLRLGEALADLGRTKEAIVQLETAVALDTHKQPRFHEALAKVRRSSDER